jgi:ATP-dependent RNA helicase RhlE
MFKRGQVTCLVATEVAARGLDIKELPQVVNYELPNVPEDYVHRIGRTGRAGANGEAISLVSSDETGLLRDIERVLRRAIPTLPTPVFKILESVPQPERAQQGGQRSHGDRPAHGNRSAQHGQHRHGGGGNTAGGDRRRSPGGGGSSSGSGTRSFGQPQRGRFR